MLEVNFLGSFAAIQAFVPVIEGNGGGRIINLSY